MLKNIIIKLYSSIQPLFSFFQHFYQTSFIKVFLIMIKHFYQTSFIKVFLKMIKQKKKEQLFFLKANIIQDNMKME